jgi:phosphate uptake regulator
MLSNEAFKRLAKSYGAMLGLSLDEIVKDKDEAALDIAEEDTRY